MPQYVALLYTNIALSPSKNWNFAKGIKLSLWCKLRNIYFKSWFTNHYIVLKMIIWFFTFFGTKIQICKKNDCGTKAINRKFLHFSKFIAKIRSKYALRLTFYWKEMACFFRLNREDAVSLSKSPCFFYCILSLSLSHDFHRRDSTQNRKIPIAASKTLYALPQRFAMDFAEEPTIYQLVFYACGAFQNRICLLLPHLWQYRDTRSRNFWIENKTWSRPIKTVKNEKTSFARVWSQAKSEGTRAFFSVDCSFDGSWSFITRRHAPAPRQTRDGWEYIKQ